jgi:hypothetical protein
LQRFGEPPTYGFWANPTAVGVDVGVEADVGVGVLVDVGTGVDVGVGDGVLVGGDVGVAVAVAVGVAVGMAAMESVGISAATWARQDRWSVALYAFASRVLTEHTTSPVRFRSPNVR